MPPLREITEDIPLTGKSFPGRTVPGDERRSEKAHAGALQRLMGYTWPGNNRQLENEIKRLIAFVRENDAITEEDLYTSIRNSHTPAPVAQESTSADPGAGRAPTNPAPAVSSSERNMIEAASLQSAGNKQSGSRP